MGYIAHPETLPPAWTHLPCLSNSLCLAKNPSMEGPFYKSDTDSIHLIASWQSAIIRAFSHQLYLHLHNELIILPYNRISQLIKQSITCVIDQPFTGAEGGTRTRTLIEHHPLKMACLPIPPLRPHPNYYQDRRISSQASTCFP